MSAKRRAPNPNPKPQWQPEHWLMFWEILLKRLHLIILAVLLGTAYLIRSAVVEPSSWDSFKKLVIHVFSSQ